MSQFSNGGEAQLQPDVEQGVETVAPTGVPDLRFLSLATDKELVHGSETILFVEDEAFVREVTSEVLQSAGYKVLAVKSADEAERTNDQYPGQVDLLLSDVILPGKSGRTLASDLRRCCPTIAVLLVSGYAQQWTRNEAEGWTEECLAKPFSATALLRRVRQVLNQRRERTRDANLLKRACDNG